MTSSGKSHLTTVLKYVDFACFLLIKVITPIFEENFHSITAVWLKWYNLEKYIQNKDTMLQGYHILTEKSFWHAIVKYHSPHTDPATHSISATTPVLFHGIFWWVTSLNVSHWSKFVIHATHVVNNDVILVACLLRLARALDGQLADWSMQDFSPHFLMSYRKKYWGFTTEKSWIS